MKVLAIQSRIIGDVALCCTISVVTLFLIISLEACTSPKAERRTKQPELPPRHMIASSIPLNADEFVVRAGYGDIEAVEYMLSKGMNPNVRSFGGETALSSAVFGGYAETAKVLVGAGADVNVIIDPTIGNTLLHDAVGDDVKPVQILLSLGADVNAVNKNGTTPLMFACRQGKIEVVKILLDAGAKVNWATPQGQTALLDGVLDGVQENRTDIVKLLLAHGANVEAKNKLGDSAMQIAKGNPELIDLLKQAGATD